MTAPPGGRDDPRLSVRGLRVVLPDGRVVIDEMSLDVAPGEVVVLLGGSGAGKSTFARVLFERDELDRAGFDVVAGQVVMDHGQLGLVPQRGALFDHLDVRGNLELAMRYAPPGGDARPGGADDVDAGEGAAARWLERVGLDRALAAPGTAVTRLSGGQAQRVAVARVLASRRRLLFLDEPSVGLDPHRVRMLARLIREQVRALGISAIVVTHDVALAAGVADRLFLLSLEHRRLEQLFAGGGDGDGDVATPDATWPGPVDDPARPVDDATRGRWMIALEKALLDHLEAHGARRADGGAAAPRRRAPGRGRAAEPLIAPFRVAGTALALAPAQLLRRPGDFAQVGRRVLAQTLLRPLLFYGVVSVLIGYTVLYVISKVGGAGVRPDALIRQIGGAYVVALAPALAAVLFVAASGSATNAWLGSMGLTRQTVALEALGVDSRAYLWAPAWVALGVAFLAVAALFALGMIVGGLLVCRQYHVPGAWDLLTADLFDPRPERIRYALRAGFLAWIYGWGIAADVVAKGSAAKPEADAVTRGMTASVVACTLWVVAWELTTVLVVLR
ncbi:MAG: ATP-binding cassette domain-containing protein [Kofleriaceae bacterium]|nr:ATP-binding cassette domain-containing protein [Kofleriaceae bacterium]